MLLCVQTTRTANAVVDYHCNYRTMQSRACCGKYIGLCAGGTSACSPYASHQTSSSRLSPYPQALPTTLLVRSSSPATPTPLPHPQAAATSCHSCRAYQAHPTTWPQTPKRHSQTRRPQAEAANSHRRKTYPPGPMPPRSGTRVPPSPSIVHAKLDQLAHHPHLKISQFVLSPQTHHATAVLRPAASEGLFSRELCALTRRNNAPTSMNSLSLSPPLGRPPADDTDRRSWRAHCGASQFGEFAG